MGKEYVVHSVADEEAIPIGKGAKLRFVGRIGQNPTISIGADGIAKGERNNELDEI